VELQIVDLRSMQRFEFQVSGFWFWTGRPSKVRNRRAPKAHHRLRKPEAQNRQSGFTLLEIIIVITILSVLTAAAVPLVRNSVKRGREIELRIALRQIRQGIDRYKEYRDRFGDQTIPIQWRTPTGYPKELKILVEGFTPSNQISTKVKFLRRLPIDPMTGKADWALRSYADRPDSTSWGGDDVFDVYSKSTDTALDGTKYKDW
jgi:general secretion pathway protein G